MGELVTCEVLEAIAESFDEGVCLLNIGAAVAVKSKGVQKLVQTFKGIVLNVADAQFEETIKQVPINKRFPDTGLDSVLCGAFEVASEKSSRSVDLRASEDQRGHSKKAFDYRRILFSVFIVPHLRQDSNRV